jgi:hypothetical protein
VSLERAGRVVPDRSGSSAGRLCAWQWKHRSVLRDDRAVPAEFVVQAGLDDIIGQRDVARVEGGFRLYLPGVLRKCRHLFRARG